MAQQKASARVLKGPGRILTPGQFQQMGGTLPGQRTARPVGSPKVIRPGAPSPGKPRPTGPTEATPNVRRAQPVGKARAIPKPPSPPATKMPPNARRTSRGPAKRPT